MAYVNNNTVYSLLNTAYNQAVGGTAVAMENLKDFVDAGSATFTVYKEAFTKALIDAVVKNWFSFTEYRSQYSDPFFEDSSQFGAIIQNINITVPEVTASSAWKDYTSGSTTLGTYTIYLPVVTAQYYAKTVSWELPIAVTGEQWDTAFKSEEELTNFVAYIMLAVDNALVVHLENTNAMNRNNFIGEKIAYANSDDATGIHVINLVQVAKDAGILTADTTTGNYLASDFLKSKDCLLKATEVIRLYKSYMGKMSKLFNTGSKARFTPDDRMVLQVISAFNEKLNTIAYSDTYHDDIVKMPLFQSVPYWQGEGTDLSWNSVTSINVTTTGNEAISQSGIVAFMCDKWAIMHTVKSKRVCAKYFEPEDITQYYYQFRDMYCNDLTMPAIVFTVADVEAE